MLNYALFVIFVFITFLLSYLTISVEKGKIQIVKNSKKILTFIAIYFTIFVLAITYSIISGKIKNMLGIDFIGGTLTELQIPSNKTEQEIIELYKKYNIEPIIQDVILQEQQKNKRTIVIKTKPLEENQRNEINKELKNLGAEIRKSENISSTIGKETLINALIALVIALIAQVIYIGFRFGNNIMYGIIADIALIHDVIVMLGTYVILGMLGFAGFEINSIFLAAVLTVVGYSVMDTIIIFDRIRENLKIEIKQNHKVTLEKFDTIINNSIIQTIVRSVFTTFTVLLTLLGIVFLGGETLRSFSIALSVGTFSGALSSILIAAPLISILKNKILSKDIKLLSEDEKSKEMKSLAENITQIFAHQQDNPYIEEKTEPVNPKIPISKSKKITDKYLKTRIIRKDKNKQ